VLHAGDEALDRDRHEGAEQRYEKAIREAQVHMSWMDEDQAS
jgi:hypothetical protein